MYYKILKKNHITLSKLRYHGTNHSDIFLLHSICVTATTKFEAVVCVTQLVRAFDMLLRGRRIKPRTEKAFFINSFVFSTLIILMVNAILY